MKKIILLIAAVLFTACSHPGRWPNATIPYILLGFDAEEQATIIGSMFLWEQATGVNFKNILFESNEDDTAVLHIIKGDINKKSEALGFSTICGYEEDKLLIVVLSETNEQMVIHELGHVLGLEHEHQRPDRDMYIFINWTNITGDGMVLLQFITKSPDLYDYREYEYDYFSCMHYSNNAGAIDRDEDAIISPVPVGVYGIPSRSDIQKVRYIQGTD